VEITAVSGADGLYRLPVVAVGTYTLRFSHEGFKTAEVPNLVVSVAQTATADVQLEVGTVTQQVTVTGAGCFAPPSRR
jgi:hypothetical protein